MSHETNCSNETLKNYIQEYIDYLQIIGKPFGFRYGVKYVHSTTEQYFNNCAYFPIGVKYDQASLHVHSYVCVKNTAKYMIGDIILVDTCGTKPSWLEDAVIGNVIFGNYEDITAVVPRVMTPLEQLDCIIDKYPHLVEMSNIVKS
jgi:hypothetical protein